MERGCVSLIYNMVSDYFYPLNDFTPVAHIGTADYAFIVHASVPAKSQ
jgi:tripartite-type tricarboxylate transporter receptor subunit TctC